MQAEDKVLDGYLYTFRKVQGNEGRTVAAYMGKAGALSIIKLLRESGLSDEIIQDSVMVCINDEVFPLKDLTIKRKDD